MLTSLITGRRNGIWCHVVLQRSHVCARLRETDWEQREAGRLSQRRGPAAQSQNLGEDGEVWEAMGFTILRLEYRASKADWGQPSFGRFLLRKASS